MRGIFIFMVQSAQRLVLRRHRAGVSLTCSDVWTSGSLIRAIVMMKSWSFRGSSLHGTGLLLSLRPSEAAIGDGSGLSSAWLLTDSRSRELRSWVLMVISSPDSSSSLSDRPCLIYSIFSEVTRPRQDEREKKAGGIIVVVNASFGAEQSFAI